MALMLNKTIGPSLSYKGLSVGQKRAYNSWSHMHDRCYNNKCKKYKNYGGRGIIVCNRWFVFENFLNDMGEKPEGVFLDRIDNNGNYKKSNCRYTNEFISAFNRRKPITNTSGVKGVCKRRNGRFTAVIHINNRDIWLGTYSSLEEAAYARRKWEEDNLGSYELR